MKPRIFIVCNAMDDATLSERAITTDSPAASKKVFELSQSLKISGVSPFVISLGRGYADGSIRFYKGTVKRVQGIPVYYAPFTHIRLLSEIISLFAPLAIIWHFRKGQKKAIIYYNRMIAYIPSLFFASVLKFRNVLDLEDGEVSSGYIKILVKLISAIFDWRCTGGAILACRALSSYTKVTKSICYYGTANAKLSTTKWKNPYVTVLMGGTLSPETGAIVLVDAIRIIRSNPLLSKCLRFEITGKGQSLAMFQELANEADGPKVVVNGRVTSAQYGEILSRSDVGLALKRISGPYANTTFPSKVIEYASEGLLVVTTDISDVRMVLGDGAMYLIKDDPQDLVAILERLVSDRNSARDCALMGRYLVYKKLSPHHVGQNVVKFVFGGDG